eukprot:1150260-Pelagomonas_calceolata.AAC.1
MFATCILRYNCSGRVTQADNYCPRVLQGLKQKGHAPETHSSSKHKVRDLAPHHSSKAAAQASPPLGVHNTPWFTNIGIMKVCEIFGKLKSTAGAYCVSSARPPPRHPRSSPRGRAQMVLGVVVDGDDGAGPWAQQLHEHECAG